jgi:hypothetical protein
LTPKPSASPSSKPSASPTPSGFLPYDSTLVFVLEGTISSGSSKTGDLVQAHLQNDIVVGGQTVAPAGTKVQIRILDAKPAENPDIYGFVDIAFGGLTLPDGNVIPLRPPASHLEVNVSAGHQSTAAVENTIGDMWGPTLLFHIFRKGRNFTLEPGALIKARTEATINIAPNGSVAITTPAPLVLEAETPHATFKSAPLATPNPDFHPQHPAPTLAPGTPCPTC